MKSPLLPDKELTLKQAKFVSQTKYDDLTIKVYDDGSKIFQVPDWETRSKTLKIILSLMSQERRERILNKLSLSDDEIAERLKDVVADEKRRMIRTGAAKKRWLILKRDEFTCQYCGAKPPDVVLHVDHIKAVAKGGNNEESNLITSCSLCNMGKGTDGIT